MDDYELELEDRHEERKELERLASGSTPSACSAVLPINYEWNPADPRCVRCGEPMFLLDGCEWSDDPAENLCHTCALGAVRDLRKLVATLGKQNDGAMP